jgi:CelD/BcsL family acetyltransferase involved in cellulose biosynthesis
MGTGLRVTLVADGAALAAEADAWAALLADSVSNRPTQSPLWLLTWWQVFGASDGRRLAVVLVHDGQRLVGLAPLLQRRRWHRRVVPFRRIELLGTGEAELDEIASDYLGVIAARGYEEPVARSIAQEVAAGALADGDEIALGTLEAALPITSHLAEAFAARGLAVSRRPLIPSPYITLPATWDAYLASLPGSGRYLINRSLRDFDKWAGPGADLVRVATPADLAEGKKVLVRLHEQRWRAAGRTGVFASQLFTQFHDALLAGMLARRALDLVWLRVRGEAVAVAYNIVWDNKVLFYQGGRTLDVPKQVRPGIVLHAHAIRAAIEAGRTEYDFLPGTEQYKRQLANASRPMVELRAARTPVRDLLCDALEFGAACVRARRRSRQMRHAKKIDEKTTGAKRQGEASAG